MLFHFVPMNAEYAHAISNWHYEGAYKFYDLDQDQEDLKAFLDPSEWPDRYFAVCGAGNELVGFLSFEIDNDNAEISLGLRPDLTGKGFGQSFVACGLEFASKRFSPKTFSLIVASFNQRAITVYTKNGCEENGRVMYRAKGG
ncbi:MAG: GNAT family N-acetyltransferase, partial [Chloroflexota bacterium]